MPKIEATLFERCAADAKQTQELAQCVLRLIHERQRLKMFIREMNLESNDETRNLTENEDRTRNYFKKEKSSSFIIDENPENSKENEDFLKNSPGKFKETQSTSFIIDDTPEKLEENDDFSRNSPGKFKEIQLSSFIIDDTPEKFEEHEIPNPTKTSNKSDTNNFITTTKLDKSEEENTLSSLLSPTKSLNKSRLNIQPINNSQQIHQFPTTHLKIHKLPPTNDFQLPTTNLKIFPIKKDKLTYKKWMQSKLAQRYQKSASLHFHQRKNMNFRQKREIKSKFPFQ